MEKETIYNEKISKGTIVDIILWAKEQEHIKGDIDLLIQTIMNQDKE